MSDPAPTVTSMTDHEAGDHLARLMLPYRRRELEDADGPDHEAGWWFTDAPPDVTREAPAESTTASAERPNECRGARTGSTASSVMRREPGTGSRRAG
jgi:hypothetical protein